EAPPEVEEDAEGNRKQRRLAKLWSRLPKFPEVIELLLDPVQLREGVEVPDSGGLTIFGHLKEAHLDITQLEPGTRAVSLFLVNRRTAAGKGERDTAYAFQV